jgi:type IV pilus assembly protein PilP
MTSRAWLGLGWLALALGGCGPSAPSDLVEWMAQQSQATTGSAPPLPSAPPPTVETVERWPVRLAPFVHVPALEPAMPTEPIASPASHGMALVGVLRRGANHLALIQVDAQLHTVRMGDRIGPHQGRVVEIADTHLVLKERAQDAHGAWTERATVLPLQKGAYP